MRKNELGYWNPRQIPNPKAKDRAKVKIRLVEALNQID